VFTQHFYATECILQFKILKIEAKDVLQNINCMQAAKRAEKCHFLSVVTLTFDLDIQTPPSEGPNTSFHVNLVQICSAVPRDISYTKKSRRQRQKQNITQFTTCGKNKRNR